MNYGYAIGASSVLTSMYRADVASNNLANLETVGFKPDSAFTVPRAAVREEDGVYNLPSNALLERLGAGVLLGPNRTSFRQGPLTPTGNPLDVAIEGSGFLQVTSPTDGRGDRLRLTRDGRLTLNKEGQLVTASSGMLVTDVNDRPITLDRSRPVSIDERGVIRQGGGAGGEPVAVAELKFVDVPDRSKLRKLGDNLWGMSAETVSSRTAASGRIIAGSIERSAVDPVRAMMQVTSAANAVGTAVRVMQIHDELMGRAISGLGSVRS